MAILGSFSQSKISQELHIKCLKYRLLDEAAQNQSERKGQGISLGQRAGYTKSGILKFD